MTESVDYKPDGSIEIVIAQGEREDRYHLRRPLLGELYERWAGLDALGRANAEQIDRLIVEGAQREAARAAITAGPVERDDGTVEHPPTSIPPQTITATEIQINNVRANATWLEATFATLATPALPPEVTLGDDENVVGRYPRPPWFSSNEIPGKFIAHWQTVPLAPGASATPTSGT